MFKISLLDINIIEAQQVYIKSDKRYIYTNNIYPELFSKPNASITMEGKIDLDTLKNLVKENTIINTLYWY
jgi:hypothetical protein